MSLKIHLENLNITEIKAAAEISNSIIGAYNLSKTLQNINIIHDITTNEMAILLDFI